VLTQREGGVVVEFIDPNRAPSGTSREQGADVVKLFGRALGDVGAVDQDRAALGAQQADQRLQEDGLTRTRRAQQNADLALRDLQCDVFPDPLDPKDFVSPSTEIPMPMRNPPLMCSWQPKTSLCLSHCSAQVGQF